VQRLNRLEQTSTANQITLHDFKVRMYNLKADLLSAIELEQYPVCPSCGANVVKISGYCEALWVYSSDVFFSAATM
jgi:hypothetical protein